MILTRLGSIYIMLPRRLGKMKQACFLPNLLHHQQRNMSYLKAHLKRFYRNVNVKKSDDGFLVQLDGKTIKTPLRHTLCLPNEMVALAVANEWHMQGKDINTSTMPLTTICNTTIDNPTNLPKEKLIDEMLRFLHTDTICALAETPESLVDLQERKWLPVRKWFEERFAVTLKASSNLFNLEQNEESIVKLQQHLITMNKWQLNGLQASIDAIKSFILPVAVLYDHLRTEEAVYLSRLELEFQIEKWGKFEGAHDVEMYNHQTSVAAGTLIWQLCAEESD